MLFSIHYMDQTTQPQVELVNSENIREVMREMLKTRSEWSMERIMAQAERSRIYQEEETGMKFPPAEMPG